MPPLAELQAGFAKALRDAGLPAPPGLRSRSPSGSGRRFDVYRNNMMASLVDALRSTFPVVHRLVGEEYFAAVARAYVEQYPPDSPVLLRYGRAFGDFLDELPSASSVPYLGDVARLEWARINALHAADAEPESIDALTRVPERLLESVVLEPHPSLNRVRSRWPVASLWSDCTSGGQSGGVDMNTSEDAVVVRPGLEVAVRTAPAGGGAFLAALERGDDLGTAVQQGAGDAGAFDLAAQLRFVFEIGAVAAVHAPAQQDQS